MSKERLYYLDAARGFAILLVVLGHIWETEQPLPVLIYSFHVPLFFIISGILIAYTEQDRRDIKRLVISRLRSLIVPYVFFEAVFILIFGLRNHFNFGSRHPHVYGCLLLSPLNVPLWFLPTLFLAELFLILLIRLTGSRKYTAITCLALYLLPYLPESRQIFPDALARCFSSIGFLSVGYFCANLVRTKELPLRFLLPSAAVSGWLALMNGKTGIYKLTFHNPVLFTVCAITGSGCTIFLLKKFASKRRLLLLELIGTNSLTVLGLHIIALRILQQILGLHTDTLPGGLLALAGICLLLIPACVFLNRFLPFLIGKRSQKELPQNHDSPTQKH